MNRQDRAATPVIATILMIAIVVILAVVISTFALGFAENFRDPAPIVGQTSGEFVPGADEQVVRITHVAGDSVPVEEIEIIVRASGPGDDLPLEARLIDLPSNDFFSSAIGETNIEGDEELIDEGNSGELNRVIDREGTNVWSTGDTIQFVINVDADFRDPPTDPDNEADELEVIIVHTPSNSVLSEYTFSP